MRFSSGLKKYTELSTALAPVARTGPWIIVIPCASRCWITVASGVIVRKQMSADPGVAHIVIYNVADFMEIDFLLAKM